MDRLDAMHLFVRVAELGSFAAVAQQLGLARSVVTRQIAALEAHLGVKLMARSTRRLSLTSAGTAYLEKCRVILNLVETAETDVAEERVNPRGNIRISLPLSFGLKRLAPLLLEFSRRYPEVGLDMDYSDRRVNLIEEGIDLSIRITRRLEGSDIARRIGSARLLAVASPDYLARHGRPQHPAELAHHECLGYTVGGTGQNWQFMVDGQLASFPVRSRIHANNGDVLTEAAAQGLGITLQPDFIIDGALAAGRIEAVLAEFPAPELGIYAMLPSNRHVPHRVRVLMDALAAGLAV
ncbi:LysR family transcriptional regulator [Dechloromonas denitrificans]|uniref:LysR family transcriptional regulator n=1 Tax=Dechloromonas denitrificans TaxID=281362 RepID=UPI001CFC2014|nr:LysR family transcriptional regulator [Dechloromonas denitrificans]UCV09385.1 LysR family transcriptional regulator [Dechloromonas denitrificans]